MAQRERYLSTDEFRRLGLALGHLKANAQENQFAIIAIRLLLYTGARLSGLHPVSLTRT